MLIKNCIYSLIISISVFSVVSLIYSVKNKNKYSCNLVIVINSVFIIYLISAPFIISTLQLPVGFEMVYILLLEFITTIILIIAIIISATRKKRTIINDKNGKLVFVTIILALLPVLILSSYIVQNEHLINSSELILIFESKRNGGIGDGDTFAFSISKNHCSQFDLKIDDAHELKKLLPENTAIINKPISEKQIFDGGYYDTEFVFENTANKTKYSITFSDYSKENTVSIYKDNEKICNINPKSLYYNIDFEEGFYKNAN